MNASGFAFNIRGKLEDEESSRRAQEALNAGPQPPAELTMFLESIPHITGILNALDGIIRMFREKREARIRNSAFRDGYANGVHDGAVRAYEQLMPKRAKKSKK